MKTQTSLSKFFTFVAIAFSFEFLFANAKSPDAHMEIQTLGPVKCEELSLLPDPTITQFKWAMNTEKISAGLNKLRQSAEVGAEAGSEAGIRNWINAYKNAFLNSNVDYKNKLAWAEQLGKQSKNIPFNIAWSILKDLYSTDANKTAQSTLVLLALQGKSDYPEAFEAELAMDYSAIPNRMLWELSQIVLNMKSITNPNLILAMRNYYLSPAPKVLRLNYRGQEVKNDFDYDKNRKRELDFHVGLLKRKFLYFLNNHSNLNKSLFAEDCKTLLFNENPKDYRKYTAFELLLENGQIDKSLVQKILTRLSEPASDVLATLLSENLGAIMAAAKTQSQLEPLLVGFFDIPSIILRSAFLKIVRDEFKFTNQDAISILKSRLPFFEGQSQLIAKKVLAESGMELDLDKKTSELKNPDILRSLIQDSIEDSIGFGSTNSPLREQLKALNSKSQKLQNKALTEEFLELIKNENWNHPLLIPQDQVQSQTRNAVELETLTELEWKPGTIFEHSMADLEDYLSQRLGYHFISFAKEKKLKVLVFAGSEEDLLNSKLIASNQILKVPNPYSQWDIERYLIFDVQNRPSLVFRIQANRELAIHYQSMLHQLGLLEVKTYLSISGLNKIKYEFTKAAELLNQKIGTESEVLILGYDYLWEYVLNLRKDWQILSTEKAEAEFGSAEIHAQKITVGHRSAPHLRKVFLVVGSHRTLWGESTVNMISALLSSQNKIKDILFLGSAGSLGFSRSLTLATIQNLSHKGYGDLVRTMKNDIYYVSVPHIFDIDQRKIHFLNSLNLNYNYDLPHGLDYNLSNQAEVKVVFCTEHGFSYSPAEQTLSWTTEALMNRVNTVDVETNLIAKFIFDYNKKFSSVKEHIKLGVAHLITDNPANKDFIWDVKNSLSAIDNKKKQELRVNLLNFVLDQWNFRIQASGDRESLLTTGGQYYFEDGSYKSSPDFSYNNFLFGAKHDSN